MKSWIFLSPEFAANKGIRARSWPCSKGSKPWTLAPRIFGVYAGQGLASQSGRRHRMPEITIKIGCGSPPTFSKESRATASRAIADVLAAGPLGQARAFWKCRATTSSIAAALM